MSHYDYTTSQALGDTDPPFASLIMAAMRRADSTNEAKLIRAWPGIWEELSIRYNQPGGYLPEEHEQLEREKGGGIDA